MRGSASTVHSWALLRLASSWEPERYVAADPDHPIATVAGSRNGRSSRLVERDAFPDAYFADTRDSIEAVVRLVVSHVMLPGARLCDLLGQLTRMASALLGEELATISGD